MPLTFDELTRAAPTPDGFPDPTQPAAVCAMTVYEFLPERDDAGGVGADIGHVGEVNPRPAASEIGLQQVDLLGAGDHHDRLARGDPVFDEGQGPGQKIGRTPIEK